MGDNEQWYTNKELFEQINSMRGEFRDFQKELEDTRKAIKKYNGLREEIGQMQKQLATLQAERQGRFSVWEGIRQWGGWIVGIAALLWTIAQT